MPDTKELSKELLDQTFLEMRWRCLSLAADLDRLDRAGASDDTRIQKLRAAIKLLIDNQPNRAARLQLLYSDQ